MPHFLACIFTVVVSGVGSDETVYKIRDFYNC